MLGNTTGSHLSGSKDNPYGELEKFMVSVDPFIKILENSDLVKIDVEGHEATLISSTTEANWLGADAIVEVGTPANAEVIYNHLCKMNISMFSQKTSWSQVKSLSDMPFSYKEGSLFITRKGQMLWENI